MKLPRQFETEVYVGTEGDLVIRQEGCDDHEDVILLRRASARAVAMEMLRLVDCDSAWPAEFDE